MHTHMHTYTRICTYTHIHIHIHSHTHTHPQRPRHWIDWADAHRTLTGWAGQLALIPPVCGVHAYTPSVPISSRPPSPVSFSWSTLVYMGVGVCVYGWVHACICVWVYGYMYVSHPHPYPRTYAHPYLKRAVAFSVCIMCMYVGHKIIKFSRTKNWSP